MLTHRIEQPVQGQFSLLLEFITELSEQQENNT